jgi:hypothetical protein
MVYKGNLTFDSDDPSKFLKIPNLVSAKKFGSALLYRHGLYGSLIRDMRTLAATGNPMDVLFRYCHLMRRHDVTIDDIANEGHHRDSIWITTLEYPTNQSMAKYQMRNVRSLLIPQNIQREVNLCSGMMKEDLSSSSLRTMRITTLSSGSRLSRLLAWNSGEEITSTKRNSSTLCS